jgi:hypothetical protein
MMARAKAQGIILTEAAATHSKKRHSSDLVGLFF